MAENREEQFDRRGYHRKEYKTRISPAVHWREEKFVARYRLSTQRVAALAKDYGEYTHRTLGTHSGGGISYFDQVHYIKFTFILTSIKKFNLNIPYLLYSRILPFNLFQF